MRTVKSVTKLGNRPVYDISVEEAEHYILENGVVTHNTGGMYSANTIFFIGKAQEKDGTEIVGWNFSINIEKSRFVKEKSRLPFTVMYEGGVDKYSGILELAVECGLVVKPSNGWYQLVDKSTGEAINPKVREKNTKNKEFLGKILDDPDFQEFVRNKYQVGSSRLLSNDDIDSVMDDIDSKLLVV